MKNDIFRLLRGRKSAAKSTEAKPLKLQSAYGGHGRPRAALAGKRGGTVMNNQRAALRYQNKVNNAQGHFFEVRIKPPAPSNSDRERADVDKTLNRVPRSGKEPRRKVQGRCRRAVDFQGTLDGGRSIQAKYTTTDRLKMGRSDTGTAGHAGTPRPARCACHQSAAGLEADYALFRGRCGGT